MVNCQYLPACLLLYVKQPKLMEDLRILWGGAGQIY